MGNKYYYIKYIILSFIAYNIAISKSRGQEVYHNYDGVTRGVEYHITKSQIEANNQMIKLLNNEKEKMSILKKEESISRSRIQGVISAKENENFRLNQKAYMLIETSDIKAR